MMKNLKRMLVVSLAAVMMISMAACGGDGGGGGGGNSKTTYSGWLMANLPEGFEQVDDYENEFTAEISGSTSEAKIKFEMQWNTTAEDQINRRLSASSDYTVGEDIKAGDITWKVLEFTWNDLPSAYFYADIPGQDGYVAEVVVFCRGADDEEIINFIKSIEFVDNAYDARDEFFKKVNEKQ